VPKSPGCTSDDVVWDVGLRRRPSAGAADARNADRRGGTALVEDASFRALRASHAKNLFAEASEKYWRIQGLPWS